MTKQQLAEAEAAATGPFATFAVQFLDLAAATDDDQAVWEPFQLEYLNLCHDQVAIAVSKTRQCGFSWLLALEAVIRGQLKPGSLTNFVSINKDEAEEKIRYADQINDALWPDVRLQWLTNNRGELEATNGSRIRSHASKPPRGRPRAHHRLDECAHYQRPKEIYDGAAPSLLRDGSIALASSPWVKGGFHYDVMEMPEQYPSFARMRIPWWEVKGLCGDVTAAREAAPSLTTLERVERFGTSRLKLLCEIMSLDAFQVECELAYADDSLAWITWDEIVACTVDPEADECAVARGLQEIEAALPALRRRAHRGPVFAGYDVARRHDKAVLALLQQEGHELYCAALFVLENTTFNEQRRLLERVTPLIKGGCIDATGLGANLAEDLRHHNAVWREFVFSQPSKAELATDLRQRFQQRSIRIPPDRLLQRDLHSVRRVVTAANNVIYEAGRVTTADGGVAHADMFWALALAVQAQKGGHALSLLTADRLVVPQHTVTGVNQDTGRVETVRYRVVDDLGSPDLFGPGAPSPGGVAAVRVRMREVAEAMHPPLRAMRERRERRQREDGWVGENDPDVLEVP